MLPGADDAAGWRRVLLALTGGAVLVYLALAFFQPFTLRYDPWVIQDDARQFLAWMPRLTDPGAMRGDLIADYWQSVSPPLYRLPFALLAWMGVPPSVTALLAPALLFPLTVLALWPVALRLLGRPIPAFCGAALVMIYLVHEDSLYSSTPRALATPLVLLFVNGLLSDRPRAILVALTLLALVYPAPAITCLAMLGLWHVRLFPRPGVDLSRRSIALVGGAALLVAGAGLSFRGEVARWKPVLTIAEVASIPSMTTPGGRSSIVGANGRIGWVCSSRIGFLPEIVHCGRREVGPGALVNLLVLLPMLLLGWRAVRRGDPADPDRLYALAFAAALICWTAAALVLFKLHLANRYSQRVLVPLELLAATRFATGLLVARWNDGTRRIVGKVAAIAMLPAFLSPIPKLKRPLDAPAVAWIAALPAGARVAGVADELNLVPALTGRPVLATTEHDIPYQLGYYRPFHRRLRDSVGAVTSLRPETIARFVRQYAIDVVVVDAQVLRTGRLTPRYRATLPEFHSVAAVPALASAPCRRFTGRHLVLFDGPCLMRWAATR